MNANNIYKRRVRYKGAVLTEKDMNCFKKALQMKMKKQKQFLSIEAR